MDICRWGGLSFAGVVVSYSWLAEPIKMWSREPWTENGDESGGNSDQDCQGNSYTDTDGAGDARDHSQSPPPSPTPSPPHPARRFGIDLVKSYQAQDPILNGIHLSHSSKRNTQTADTTPNKQHHDPQ